MRSDAEKRREIVCGGCQEERRRQRGVAQENTEALSIRVRREKAEAYRELASRRGQSLSSIVWQYLDGECEKEGIVIEKP